MPLDGLRKVFEGLGMALGWSIEGLGRVFTREARALLVIGKAQGATPPPK